MIIEVDEKTPNRVLDNSIIIVQDDCEMTIKLPMLMCKRPGCKHVWIPRKPNPKYCPACKQLDWNKPHVNRVNDSRPKAQIAG